MSDNFETQRQQLQNMLDKVTDQVKASAEAAHKEVKNVGDLAEASKRSVDELLIAQGELKNRVQSMEQAFAAADEGKAKIQHTSAGAIVVNSEELEAFAGGRGGKSSVTVSLNGGFSVFNAADANAITSATTNGKTIYAPDRDNTIRGLGQCRLTVRDLLNKGRTGSGAYEFVKEAVFTNNAASVKENPTNDKPQSKSTFTLVNEPVVTIAHWMRASKQILSDAPALQSFIDGKLRYGLAVVEETQLLKGTGATYQQLNGLYTQATAFVPASGAAPSGWQLIDTLRMALLQSELACYQADGIVMSPQDWAGIELLKDGEYRYLVGNPFGSMTPVIWGRSVVTSKALAAGEWLVGAFGEQAQLLDREDATVTISLEDRDNFVRNMVTILAEQREVLAVYQPAAFIKNA